MIHFAAGSTESTEKDSKTHIRGRVSKITPLSILLIVGLGASIMISNSVLISENERSPAVSYAKVVPKDAKRFYYVAENKVVQAIAKQIKPAFLEGESIEAIVTFRTSAFDRAVLYDGSFERENIVNQLKKENYQNKRYRDVNYLAKGGTGVIFLKSYLIIGSQDDIKKSIDASKDVEDSFYNNENVNRLFFDLRYDDMVNINTAPYTAWENLNVLADTTEILDENGEKINVQGLFIFDSEGDAQKIEENFERTIRSRLENAKYEDIRFERRGETIEVYIEELRSGIGL